MRNKTPPAADLHFVSVGANRLLSTHSTVKWNASMSPWLVARGNKQDRRKKKETYKEEYVLTFLKNQGQLFAEPIAETFEEAEAFLEECLAVVVDSLKEVREFLEEEGLDVEGLSDKELEEQSEVFRLPDGKYLIVEG